MKSYLEPRRANVVVAGAMSREMKLENTVFQGTRLGPPLWNVHFQDVSVSVPDEYQETKFADDLSCSKAFEGSTPNEHIYNDLHACQNSVHAWGRLNQVIFEHSKEEFAILHSHEGEGEDFKALGTWMDTTLRMETNVRRMLAKARPKVTALLRSRKYYSRHAMVNQYKAHVLCLMEVNLGGFYHALDSILEPVQKLQDHFTRELGLDRKGAFLEDNLAPLSTRRDIGMLGLLYKCAHGKTHSDLQKLFERAPSQEHVYITRFRGYRHRLQLMETRPGTHHALLRRSIFGLTRVWNRLPKDVVMANTVADMQIILTQMVRGACSRDETYWEDIFSPRPELLPETPHFQELFDKRVYKSYFL